MSVSVISAARAVLVAALPPAVEVMNSLDRQLPRRVVRVSRAGGPRGVDLDRPRLLVECYASRGERSPDGQQAEQDAYTAVDALLAAEHGGPWAGAWITGFGDNDERDISVVEYPDPEQPSHARWQFTGKLFVLVE